MGWGGGKEDPVVDVAKGVVVGAFGAGIQLAPEVGPVGGRFWCEVVEPVQGRVPLGGVGGVESGEDQVCVVVCPGGGGGVGT